MTPGLGTTDMAIEIRFLKTAFSQLALLVLVLLGGGQTALAAPDIEITEMSCMTSPGGYWWAIEQANATAGRDTIQVRKSFTVDDCKHFPAEQYPDLHVTESVDIVGNGFTVYGNVGFVDANGNFNRHGVCPLDQDGYLVVGYGGGFIDIGQRNVDNQGIEVTVTGLNMSRLTGVAMVRKNAKLRIENSLIQDTYSVYHQVCNEPIIIAEDHSDLTLVDTKFERVSVPETGYPDTTFPVVTSAIRGNGGNLVMDRVALIITPSTRLRRPSARGRRPSARAVVVGVAEVAEAPARAIARTTAAAPGQRNAQRQWSDPHGGCRSCARRSAPRAYAR